MAVAISSSTKSNGLEVWMDRVLEGSERVQPEWGADDVHDLRVALRRSRTMADALSEVNPGPGWRKLRKTSRDLFQVLGDLRDSQVERAWVKKLGPAGDPLRGQILRLLSRRRGPAPRGTLSTHAIHADPPLPKLYSSRALR